VAAAGPGTRSRGWSSAQTQREKWKSGTRHHDKNRKLGVKSEERFVDVSDTNGAAGPLDKWKSHGTQAILGVCAGRHAASRARLGSSWVLLSETAGAAMNHGG